MGLGQGEGSCLTDQPPHPYGFSSLLQSSSKLDSTLASPLLASPRDGDSNGNGNSNGNGSSNSNNSIRVNGRNNNSSQEQKNRPNGWNIFRRYGSTDDMDASP